MFSLFLSVLEINKEYLIVFSIIILYITYYLLEAVKVKSSERHRERVSMYLARYDKYVSEKLGSGVKLTISVGRSTISLQGPGYGWVGQRWMMRFTRGRPQLVGGDAALREALADVAVLHERYWPTPWCVEGRLQTVVGSVARSLALPRAEYSRQVLRLADGGQVALDWVETGAAARAGGGVLLVVPGLTGGTHAEYVRVLAGAAGALGARCVVCNHRGAGGLALTSPRLYSAVSHGDLAEAVAAVAARARGPLLCAGVSLGGLVLAQYLAAAGRAARVAAALAVSAPLDVERAAACVARAGNAPLAWHMARNLRGAVRAHAALAPHHAAVARARTVRQFDAAFTAAHFGFASADHYYAAATLRGKLARVAVPLLCLCAGDDPFQPAAALPRAEAARAPRVALAVTARGGHIGFLEGLRPARRAPDQYIARVARQYFAAVLARPKLLHVPPPDADALSPDVDADSDALSPDADGNAPSPSVIPTTVPCPSV